MRDSPLNRLSTACAGRAEARGRSPRRELPAAYPVAYAIRMGQMQQLQRLYLKHVRFELNHEDALTFRLIAFSFTPTGSRFAQKCSNAILRHKSEWLLRRGLDHLLYLDGSSMIPVIAAALS